MQITAIIVNSVESIILALKDQFFRRRQWPRKAVLKLKKNTYEHYFFSIDNWFRDYRFGINRHPWEFSPDHHEEHDTIIVSGPLRNKTKRKFNRGSLHICASYYPRSERSDEIDRIGNAWVEDGVLNCSAWVESNTFHSLTPALAANCFKEMTFTVCNLRYNKGSTDFFTLDSKLTDLSEDD